MLSVSLVGLAGCSSDLPDGMPPSSTPPSRSGSTSTNVPSTAGGSQSAPPASNDRPRFGAFGTARMGFFSDCPQLLGYLREHTLERVTEWGLGFGGGYTRYYMAGAAESTVAAADSSGGVKAAPAATLPDHSETNTQEAGVDEGDVVETNGTHLFVAGQDGVRIVEVATAKVVATLELPQGSHQLILDGARLMVATQPQNSGQEIVVSLFDVADPAAPVLLERQHLEGSLVAARASGGTARLVLTSQLATRLPFVNPSMFGYTTERALAENQRIVKQTPIADWMPRTFREGSDGSYSAVATALDCSAVAAPSEFAGLGITWVASIDLADSGNSTSQASTVRASAGVVSQSGTVYQSASNLYLATVPWDVWYPASASSTAPSSPPPTYIHQFTLGTDGSVKYLASGEVTGQLLNQFAMSELDGDLRVATTVNDWSGSGANESFVKVLRPQGDQLVEVGSLGGLGKGEQIYAVRFLGTQAYVVTFKQVDPLYVVDLAEPTAPRLAGELKIPGYSAYLHPVGDGLLLGVGQSATEEGRVQGTQLSLFDVRDPANPVQVSTLLLGGRSEAEWDHHAFLYWPESDQSTGETVGTIVIPSSPMWSPCPADARCLGSDITSPAGGVIVAELRGTTLKARGVIQHKNGGSTAPCWNPLQRAVVIGNELATIGFDQVQFADRVTLAVRGAARWGTPDQYGCMYYGG